MKEEIKRKYVTHLRIAALSLSEAMDCVTDEDLCESTFAGGLQEIIGERLFKLGELDYEPEDLREMLAFASTLKNPNLEQ